MSLVMLKVKQHLSLEIAKRKFLNNGYGKYWPTLFWAIAQAIAAIAPMEQDSCDL